jgi:hypothetical protein
MQAAGAAAMAVVLAGLGFVGAAHVQSECQTIQQTTASSCPTSG